MIHFHDDYFPEDTEDQVWLAEVGKFGWVVLTKDKWIRRRAIERDAFLNAGLRVFCFMSGEVPFSEAATIIAAALPKIKRFADTKPPPFIAGIYKDSSVKLLITS